MNDASLPAVLARMTACDGLSFNIFTTSMDLRKSIAALGYSLPRSVVGIRDQVLKYGQQLRQDITRNLSIIKSKGNISVLPLMNGHPCITKDISIIIYTALGSFGT